MWAKRRAKKQFAKAAQANELNSESGLSSPSPLSRDSDNTGKFWQRRKSSGADHPERTSHTGGISAEQQITKWHRELMTWPWESIGGFAQSFDAPLLQLQRARLDEIRRGLRDLEHEKQQSLSNANLLHPQDPEFAVHRDSDSFENHCSHGINYPILEAQLIELWHLWSVRITALSTAPLLQRDLDNCQSSIISAWQVLECHDAGTSMSTVAKTSFERNDKVVIAKSLEGHITQLGHRLDEMVNLLNGTAENIPHEWLDQMDDIENGYSSWMVQAEEVLLHKHKSNNLNNSNNFRQSSSPAPIKALRRDAAHDIAARFSGLSGLSASSASSLRGNSFVETGAEPRHESVRFSTSSTSTAGPKEVSTYASGVRQPSGAPADTRLRTFTNGLRCDTSIQRRWSIGKRRPEVTDLKLGRLLKPPSLASMICNDRLDSPAGIPICDDSPTIANMFRHKIHRKPGLKKETNSTGQSDICNYSFQKRHTRSETNTTCHDGDSDDESVPLSTAASSPKSSPEILRASVATFVKTSAAMTKPRLLTRASTSALQAHKAHEVHESHQPDIQPHRVNTYHARHLSSYINRNGGHIEDHDHAEFRHHAPQKWSVDDSALTSQSTICQDQQLYSDLSKLESQVPSERSLPPWPLSSASGHDDEEYHGIGYEASERIHDHSAHMNTTVSKSAPDMIKRKQAPWTRFLAKYHETDPVSLYQMPPHSASMTQSMVNLPLRSRLSNDSIRR